MTSMPLMLFAAGFGKRMGALTRDRPKPLIRVAGRALIDHALDLARDAGAAPVVVNLHYKAAMLAAHLSDRNVKLSLESPDILDTGGGLRAALPLLGSSVVATLNSDALWRGPNPLVALGAAWNPGAMDGLVMCIPAARAVGRKGPGDFTANARGQITRGGDLVYGGAQIIRTGGLDDIPLKAFSLNLLWDRMIASNRLCVAIYPGIWCDVGHPEGIVLAENMAKEPDV